MYLALILGELRHLCLTCKKLVWRWRGECLVLARVMALDCVIEIARVRVFAHVMALAGLME